MDLTDRDLAVLAWLRDRGLGTVTVRGIAEDTGLSRVMAEVSLQALSQAGLACLVQWVGDMGTGQYVLRHLHAVSGPCGIPLAERVNDGAGT